ncbi:ring finger [Pyrenophora seminiperda CCB06]|uniref:Ring finger n=1 Tax=Pyrenophora seminiperda CCB06 TaxID=1302712 RepID=A0A3M7M242_9PLEO|nr:ring finger [Pyrenophora seminiperda CCB06]
MDKFLDTQLHPADTCNICAENFDAVHQPVALPCKHIFGYECIKKWLKGGRGNSNACPTCRYIVVPKPERHPSFDVPSIWQALRDEPPERLHSFMAKIWSGLQVLWQRQPTGNFTVTSLLDEAIIPGLVSTARGINAPPGNRVQDPILNCYNLLAASWDSIGRLDMAAGLAIPLVRLARLMANAGAVLPKWLTTNARINRLIWLANACLPINAEHISWDYLNGATQPKDFSHMPLLHLYTVLISQSIAHLPDPEPYPKKRHELMNLVIKRCCTKIGGTGYSWKSRPSNEFKDALVVVYEELRRHQIEKEKKSLRGHEGEESLVKGIWALAGWGGRRETSPSG